MNTIAMWSALGGGAACAVVAGIAIESGGGFAPLLAKLNSPAPPAQILAVPTPSPEPAQKAEPASGAPAFDVVRVETSGETVIAGHAAPRAAVELRDDGKGLARVNADDGGQFVIIPDPLGAGDHKLLLAARVGDGPEMLSKIVPVTVAAAKLALATKPAPMIANPPPAAPKPMASASPALAAASPTPAAKPTLAATAKPEPAAPASVIALAKPTASPTPVALAAKPAAAPVAAAPKPTPTPTAVALVEPAPMAPPTPQPEAPAVSAHIRVAVVKTTDSGGLEAEGAADPGTRLRLKLNGSFVAEVTPNANGHWSLSIDHGLTTGFYALRAEALDANGRAQGAAESSFAYAQRTAPIVVANAGPAPLASPQPAKPAIAAFATAAPSPTPTPKPEMAVATSTAPTPSAPSPPPLPR